MASIQKHKRFGCATYGELQEMYMDRIICCKPNILHNSVFVGNRYDFEPLVSLKQEEREKQGQSGSSSGKNINSIVVLEFPTGTWFHKT